MLMLRSTADAQAATSYRLDEFGQLLEDLEETGQLLGLPPGRRHAMEQELPLFELPPGAGEEAPLYGAARERGAVTVLIEFEPRSMAPGAHRRLRSFPFPIRPDRPNPPAQCLPCPASTEP